MTLKEQVQADLVAAMKAQDELKKGALRMLKAAIMKWETDGEKREADDAAVLQIVQREVKGRRDAAEAFKSGGNAEMAAKEEAELEILMAYMPAQMSEDEVRAEVSKILSEAGINSKAEMGKAMGLIMAKLKGKADGGVINKIVGESLK
jgi:uncharacterized protein YqeY